MITKFLEWIRSLLRRLSGDNRISSSLEVLMDDATVTELVLWADMYADESPWIDNVKTHSLGLANAIAYEIARLATLELKTYITGSTRADYLNTAYKKALNHIRVQVEYACALGGLILKPYVQGDRIAIDFVHADKFYPTAFDSSGNITGAIFGSTIRREGTIYTRIESHQVETGGYRVINLAYASKTKESLGHEVSLTDVPEWANIEPTALIQGVDRPLFSYFKIPQANHKNRNSPLGVSVYGKAADLIRKADEQYSRILWEFEGSELAIDAAESLFKRDPVTDKPILPKGKDRLFRAHEINTGIQEKIFMQPFSPTIRDSSLFNGLNKILQRIEFACGLAYGTISDAQVEAKTATEVLTSRQRSYDLVSDIQTALQEALEGLIEVMDIYATLYRLAPAGSYTTSFDFDDSLIVDSQTENTLSLQEVSQNILRPEIYLMRRYKVSEEEAKSMMPQATEDLPMEE